MLRKAFLKLLPILSLLPFIDKTELPKHTCMYVYTDVGIDKDKVSTFIYTLDERLSGKTIGNIKVDKMNMFFESGNICRVWVDYQYTGNKNQIGGGKDFNTLFDIIWNTVAEFA